MKVEEITFESSMNKFLAACNEAQKTCLAIADIQTRTAEIHYAAGNSEECEKAITASKVELKKYKKLEMLKKNYEET